MMSSVRSRHNQNTSANPEDQGRGKMKDLNLRGDGATTMSNIVHRVTGPSETASLVSEGSDKIIIKKTVCRTTPSSLRVSFTDYLAISRSLLITTNSILLPENMDLQSQNPGEEHLKRAANAAITSLRTPGSLSFMRPAAASSVFSGTICMQTDVIRRINLPSLSKPGPSELQAPAQVVSDIPVAF